MLRTSTGRARAAIACGMALAFATPAVADRWERIRREVIDPLNGELHRHFPRYLQERDLEAVLDLYATATGTGILGDGPEVVANGRRERVVRWSETGEETIEARYRRILDVFSTIEKAELRIHRIFWEDGSERAVPADVRLLVRGLTGAGDERAQLDQWSRVEVGRKDDLWRIFSEEVTSRELVRAAEPGFAFATEAAGVHSVHEAVGSPPFRLIGDVVNSSGVAIADIDGDGCEDFVLGGSPRTDVFRNLCNGRFENATDRSGLPVPFRSVPTGLVFLDFDEDGDPDLWATAIAGGSRLFRNDGGFRFEDVTDLAGDLSDDGWASMPVVADYDRDGDLDVYVVRMGDHEKVPPRPNYEADNGRANLLYRNEGDGTFVEVGRAAGVDDTGWGLAGAWADYDDDGWPDLYVANEFGFNALLRNEGDGTFTDVAHEAGASDRAAGMGVAWGDVDNDGDLDLYVSNMYANSRWALFHPEFPSPVPWYARVLRLLFPETVRTESHRIIHALTRGSTLLRNQGDGTFLDVSESAGIRDGQWGWGAELLDYDNDGWLDLYAANGFVTGELLDDV